MPYLGGAFAGLSAQSGIDYANNDNPDSDLYRLGESPNVNMDPGPGNSLTDHPGDFNRGAYSVTTSYKIGWTDGPDWEDYTRDLGLRRLSSRWLSRSPPALGHPTCTPHCMK